MNPFFVKTSGNKKGEPLVMIHGWGMNSGAWATIREALEADFFIHWVDLPGYGQNSQLIANNMDDIVELILPHIPDGSHLMGWSLGGLVAQAIAEQSQDNKLISLTLVATSPKFSQSGDWKHAISLDVFDNFSKSLQDDIQGTLKRFVALQFMGVRGVKVIQKALIDEILDKIIPSESYKTGKKRGGVLLNTLKTPQIEALELGLDILKTADYRKTTHDTLQHWILAGRDRLIPPAVINDLKLLRPDDQITLLENTGHAPFMTHPKEFLACMIPFIKNHGASAENHKAS